MRHSFRIHSFWFNLKIIQKNLGSLTRHIDKKVFLKCEWSGFEDNYLEGQNAKLSFLLFGVELSVDGDTVLDAENSGQTFFQSLWPQHLRERRVRSLLLHEDRDVIIGWRIKPNNEEKNDIEISSSISNMSPKW